MKKTTTIAFWLSAVLLVVCAGNALAAGIWVGGEGDWVSTGNNWGLGAGVYPGDATHPTDTATIGIAGSVVRIKTGDSITLTSGRTYVNSGRLEQTGGTAIFGSQVNINGTRYDINGGTATGAVDLRTTKGGILSVGSGGRLGTRLVDTKTTTVSFVDTLAGYSGSFLVGDGSIIDLQKIDMDASTGTGVTYVVEATGVAGSATYNRATLYWDLMKNANATSATAKFVFTSSGLTGWRVGSNNGLNLGVGVNRGLLDVDVSAFKNDGTTEFKLIDYLGTIQGDGTFGSINITDSELGAMTLGTQGALNPGEYYLSYTGTSGTDIVLYYNNIPEPSTMALIGIGLAFVAVRKRTRK